MMHIDRNLYENVFWKNEKYNFIYYKLRYETICHWHNQIEVLWVKEGIVSATVNNESFDVEKNNLLIIPPGCTHSYAVAGPCSHHVFLTDENFFQKTDVFSEFVSPFLQNNLRYIKIKFDEHPILFNIFSQIETEYFSQNTGSVFAVRALTELFFINLYRYSNPTTQKPLKNFDKYKEAILYIASHYSQDFSMADILKEIHFSPQHFCRMFKSYSGMTFKQYLITYRLKKAHALLKNTDKSVESIARETGFNDTGYFIRAYKKLYNTTPGKIRKL